VTALRELQPIVIQTFPAMLPRLNSALAKGMSLLSESDRKKISDLDNKRSDFGPSFEERIEELEKADSEGKLTDAMILRALISGLKTEEQFKILEPWLDKMTDPEGRAGSMHYFWFKRSQLATKEKRFADAQKFAVKVPELEHQAILWFEIAEKQLADINDSATAYQTLADVGKVARRAEDSVGKAQVLLGLANLYEKLNHSFAISELSDAVTVINKVKDADLQSKYLLRYIQVKDMSFGASFSTPGYDLETTFSALSKTDFSLPLSNARTIDDKYYRTLAVIAIAKNCIDRPKKKPESAGIRSQK
jgi:tetratricopeptide (TPR) repeat protein